MVDNLMRVAAEPRVADSAERCDSAEPAAAGSVGPHIARVRRWLERPWAARVVWVVLLAETGILVWFAVNFQAIDFTVYMWGGREVTHGTQLYLGSSGPNYFTYTPLAAIVFNPVALVPAALAQALWELVSVGALAVAAHTILKLAGWRPTRTETAALTAVGLVLEPVWHTLFSGQVNLFLLAIVSVDVWRVATGRRGGGLGTGIAAAVKLTPAIFIVLFLLTRRTRAAVTASVTFAACALIGFLAAPAASWLYWTRVFYDTTRVYPAYIANQSVYGAAIRIFGGAAHVGLWYLPATIAVAVAGLGSAAVFARRRDWLRALSVTGVTGLLVSPVSWTHHWVYVLPALITLVRDGRRARVAAAAAFVLFGLAPLWWTPYSLLHPTYGFHGPVTLVANCYVIAGLTFIAYMAWRACQAQEPGHRPAADASVPGMRAITPAAPLSTERPLASVAPLPRWDCSAAPISPSGRRTGSRCPQRAASAIARCATSSCIGTSRLALRFLAPSRRPRFPSRSRPATRSSPCPAVP